MKNNNYNMRDIKMVMQKNNLQISTIRRTKMGPYTVGTLKPGQYSETDFSDSLKMAYFKHMKKKVQEKQIELSKKLRLVSGVQQNQFDVIAANKGLLDGHSGSLRDAISNHSKQSLRDK